MILKGISTLLICAFLAQEVAWANPELKPIQWNQKQDFSAWAKSTLPSIPESVATIEDAYKAPNSQKTVILIQDAHTNNSGQMNVARALDLLMSSETNPVKYIFLEAGHGNESLSFLRKYATTEKRKEAADLFLGQGKLQGSEYIDLTSNHNLVLWGVEDMSLYDKSVSLYRDVVKVREKFEDYLSRVEFTVKTLKPRIFNPFLLSFDEKHQKYKKEEISLTDYFDVLSKEAERQNISLNNFPHLGMFKNLRDLESKIDFKKANEEQSKAIASLSQIDQKELLETHSTQKLSNHDQKTQLAFFALLKEKLGKNLSTCPELSKYISYLEASKDIQAKAILEEQKSLEKKIFDSLSQSEDERNLVKASKNLEFLKKILKLTLAPEEFKEYQQDKQSFSITQITGFLNRKIMDLRRDYERAIFLESGYEDTIQKCEEFYNLTYQRDQAFLQNMLPKMEEENQNTAVLITGGYHDPNLKELLKKQNISYICLTPQILKETNIKRYEELLLNQFSPIKTQVLLPMTVNHVMTMRLMMQYKLDTPLGQAPAWQLAHLLETDQVSARAIFEQFKAEASRIKNKDSLMNELIANAKGGDGVSLRAQRSNPVLSDETASPEAGSGSMGGWSATKRGGLLLGKKSIPRGARLAAYSVKKAVSLFLYRYFRKTYYDLVEGPFSWFLVRVEHEVEFDKVKSGLIANLNRSPVYEIGGAKQHNAARLADQVQSGDDTPNQKATANNDLLADSQSTRESSRPAFLNGLSYKLSWFGAFFAISFPAFWFFPSLYALIAFLATALIVNAYHGFAYDHIRVEVRGKEDDFDSESHQALFNLNPIYWQAGVRKVSVNYTEKAVELVFWDSKSAKLFSFSLGLDLNDGRGPSDENLHEAFLKEASSFLESRRLFLAIAGGVLGSFGSVKAINYMSLLMKETSISGVFVVHADRAESPERAIARIRELAEDGRKRGVNSILVFELAGFGPDLSLGAFINRAEEHRKGFNKAFLQGVDWSNVPGKKKALNANPFSYKLYEFASKCAGIEEVVTELTFLTPKELEVLYNSVKEIRKLDNEGHLMTSLLGLNGLDGQENMEKAYQNFINDELLIDQTMKDREPLFFHSLERIQRAYPGRNIIFWRGFRHQDHPGYQNLRALGYRAITPGDHPMQRQEIEIGRKIVASNGKLNDSTENRAAVLRCVIFGCLSPQPEFSKSYEASHELEVWVAKLSYQNIQELFSELPKITSLARDQNTSLRSLIYPYILKKMREEKLSGTQKTTSPGARLADGRFAGNRSFSERVSNFLDMYEKTAIDGLSVKRDLHSTLTEQLTELQKIPQKTKAQKNTIAPLKKSLDDISKEIERIEGAMNRFDYEADILMRDSVALLQNISEDEKRRLFDCLSFYVNDEHVNDKRDDDFRKAALKFLLALGEGKPREIFETYMLQNTGLLDDSDDESWRVDGSVVVDLLMDRAYQNPEDRSVRELLLALDQNPEGHKNLVNYFQFISGGYHLNFREVVEIKSPRWEKISGAEKRALRKKILKLWVNYSDYEKSQTQMGVLSMMLNYKKTESQKEKAILLYELSGSGAEEAALSIIEIWMEIQDDLEKEGKAHLYEASQGIQQRVVFLLSDLLGRHPLSKFRDQGIAKKALSLILGIYGKGVTDDFLKNLKPLGEAGSHIQRDLVNKTSYAKGMAAIILKREPLWLRKNISPAQRKILYKQISYYINDSGNHSLCSDSLNFLLSLGKGEPEAIFRDYMLQPEHITALHDSRVSGDWFVEGDLLIQKLFSYAQKDSDPNSSTRRLLRTLRANLKKHQPYTWKALQEREIEPLFDFYVGPDESNKGGSGARLADFDNTRKGPHRRFLSAHSPSRPKSGGTSRGKGGPKRKWNRENILRAITALADQGYDLNNRRKLMQNTTTLISFVSAIDESVVNVTPSAIYHAATKDEGLGGFGHWDTAVAEYAEKLAADRLRELSLAAETGEGARLAENFESFVAATHPIPGESIAVNLDTSSRASIITFGLGHDARHVKVYIVGVFYKAVNTSELVHDHVAQVSVVDLVSAIREQSSVVSRAISQIANIDATQNVVLVVSPDLLFPRGVQDTTYFDVFVANALMNPDKHSFIKFESNSRPELLTAAAARLAELKTKSTRLNRIFISAALAGAIVVHIAASNLSIKPIPGDRYASVKPTEKGELPNYPLALFAATGRIGLDGELDRSYVEAYRIARGGSVELKNSELKAVINGTAPVQLRQKYAIAPLLKALMSEIYQVTKNLLSIGSAA